VAAKLVVVSGPNAGAEHHLMTNRAVAGRADDADVVVIDRSVSRRHIELARDARGYTLRDLGSGNGTFLNGSRIREAELINGDRIELGSTVLEYLEHPPMRQAHERQVVYAVDRGDGRGAAPATGPAHSSPAGPPGQMVVGAAAPPGQLQVPVPKRAAAAAAARRGRPKKSGAAAWLVALLAFLFLGLAGAVGYVFYQRANTAEPSERDVAAMQLQEGQAALERMDWSQAQDYFNAVLRADPANETAATGLGLASTEQRYAGLLAEAERLISVGEYNHAIVNLRNVISASQRQRPLAEARLNRLFDELVTEGRAAVDRGDFGAAEAFASVVVEANNQHRSAAALLDEVEVVRGQRAVAVVDPGAPPTPVIEERTTRRSRDEEARSRRGADDGGGRERTSRSTRTSETERVETPTPAPTALPTPVPTPTVAAAEPEVRSERSSQRSEDDPARAFARGLSLYREGNFAGSASFFEGYASSHSGALGDEASQHAERIRSFADAFVPGRESFQSGDYDVAVHDLRRANSIDRRIDGAYQDEITQMLADSYYQLAQTRYNGGDYRDAGENARIALRYDRNHSRTLGLVRHLEERANELYINAVSFRESNPERARQLCRDIENMLPESSELRRRASELLSQL
jgi:tetratricopeptide (TPR) repeat protein